MQAANYIAQTWSTRLSVRQDASCCAVLAIVAAAAAAAAYAGRRFTATMRADLCAVACPAVEDLTIAAKARGLCDVISTLEQLELVGNACPTVRQLEICTCTTGGAEEEDESAAAASISVPSSSTSDMAAASAISPVPSSAHQTMATAVSHPRLSNSLSVSSSAWP